MSRRQTGNFSRLIPPHSLKYLNDVRLPGEKYYFAGFDDSDLYLADGASPNRIVVIDSGLLITRVVRMTVTAPVELNSIQTLVPGKGNIYIVDGQKSMWLHAVLPDSVLKSASLGSHHFTKAIAAQDHTFIVQIYDTSKQQNVYKRLNVQSGFLTGGAYIPVKQGDGVFSIDGIMLANANHRQFVFVYFYRNRFDVLDADLNLISSGRTIDGTSAGNIQVASSRTLNKTYMTGNTLVINKQACVSGDRLYIQSGVSSVKETPEILKDRSVIDVYAVGTGEYIQSLYALDFRGRKLNAFVVRGDKFIGLFGDYLASFSITRIKSELSGAR